MITRIRIPSKWQNPNIRQGETRVYEVADFKLGLGPCGKEATFLDLNRDRNGVTVTQVCGNERKDFFYPYELLTGRVETTRMM